MLLPPPLNPLPSAHMCVLIYYYCRHMVLCHMAASFCIIATTFSTSMIKHAHLTASSAAHLCLIQHNNLGNALREAGRYDEAVACYSACIQLQYGKLAAQQQAAATLGAAGTGTGRMLLAGPWSHATQRAVAAGPAAAVAAAVAALTTSTAVAAPSAVPGATGQGALVSSASCPLLRPVALPPGVAARLSVAYNNLGGILKMTGQSASAITCYEQVVFLQPDSPEGHANLASAYKDATRHDVAITAYRRALVLRPDFPEAFASLVHSLQCVCDWAERPALFARLEAEVRD
jgi:protein O-GlcNAc transferase